MNYKQYQLIQRNAQREINIEVLDEECFPNDSGWVLEDMNLTPEQKNLAAIDQNQSMANLYAPGEEEPCDFIVYTDEVDLRSKLADLLDFWGE